MLKVKFGAKAMIGICTIGILGATVLFSSGFSSPKVHYNLSANDSVKDLPSGFQRSSNIKANLDKLGYVPSKTKADIVLNFDLTPINGDSLNRQLVTGTGVLHVGTSTFPFKISSSSKLYQKTLSNGKSFIWGPIDASIKGINGIENDIALGLSFVPETNEQFITATVGNLDTGFAALTFGSNFTTKEMLNLISEHH